MDEPTYQLEEAVLCGRYGIVGYRTDTTGAGIDADIDTDTSDVPTENDIVA